MKKIIIGLSLLFFFSVKSHALDAVYTRSGQPESNYVLSQSTISVSSSAVTTISAVSGYREIYLGDPTLSVPVYYRIDGSTESIPTVGWWVQSPSQKIETNGVVSLQLGAGVSSLILRKIEIRK